MLPSLSDHFQATIRHKTVFSWIPGQKSCTKTNWRSTLRMGCRPIVHKRGRKNLRGSILFRYFISIIFNLITSYNLHHFYFFLRWSLKKDRTLGIWSANNVQRQYLLIPRYVMRSPLGYVLIWMWRKLAWNPSKVFSTFWRSETRKCRGCCRLNGMNSGFQIHQPIPRRKRWS